MEHEKEQDDLVKFLLGMKAIGSVLHEVGSAINTYIDENKEEFKALVEYFESYEKIQGGMWIEAAENGWFLNDFITNDFGQYIQKGKESLDSYMVEKLRPITGCIHESLVAKYSDRKHILDAAFDLHHTGSYIGAIPLFLSQTDGICAQRIGSYLFTEHDKRIEKIQKLIEDSPEKAVILAPLLQNTQFGASIGKSARNLKNKAPNRSGILHGSRKHLDYGSEINSLKCISLLSYVADMFDED